MVSAMILTAPQTSRSRPTWPHRKIWPLYSTISWCILLFPMFFMFVLFWFFFAGIIYDVIVEPPSIGSTTDERGNSKPVSTTGRWSIGCKHIQSTSKFCSVCHLQDSKLPTVTLQAEIHFSIRSWKSVSPIPYIRQILSRKGMVVGVIAP